MLEDDGGREQRAAQGDGAMPIHQNAVNDQNGKSRNRPQTVGRDHDDKREEDECDGQNAKRKIRREQSGQHAEGRRNCLAAMPS